jgi:uncharacterized membrane protein (UPF0136 family)
MPVLPDVGSRMLIPGFSTPRFSASFTRAAPMRHLTEKVGFRASIFASTVAFALLVTRFKRTRGVLPMDSALFKKMDIINLIVEGEIYGADTPIFFFFFFCFLAKISKFKVSDNTYTAGSRKT